MAAAITLLIVADGAFSVSSAGNDRAGAVFAQGLAEAVGVIALVAEQVSHTTGALEQRRGSFHVADIACCQHQGIGPTQDIGQGMDLGCPAAAGATDRLALAPPFPPNAERWALM